MNREPCHYYSYLIRIWETQINGQQTWFASLERPELKERVGFSNIDELFAFIKNDVGSKDSNEAQGS